MWVCVCVYGIIVLNIFVERWFWELKMLIGSLVKLHAWLHLYLCFSLLEKLFLTISTPPRHLAICRALKLFLITISKLPRQLGESIEKVPGSSIASRQLVDRSSFFSYLCCFVPRHLLDSCICQRFKLLTPFSIDVSTPLSVEIYWTSI